MHQMPPMYGLSEQLSAVAAAPLHHPPLLMLLVCRLEEVLAQANMAFTLLFTAEMVAKLVGLGPWAYLTDAWSLFDALVVAFSLVELVTELMARSSGGGLTALRYACACVSVCVCGCDGGGGGTCAHMRGHMPEDGSPPPGGGL